MTENELKRIILEYFELQGIEAWRNNTGVARSGGRYIAYGCPGSPDIIAIVPPYGKFLGVELKDPLKRTRKETECKQTLFGQKITKTGGAYLIAKSLEDVVTVVSAIRESQSTFPKI